MRYLIAFFLFMGALEASPPACFTQLQNEAFPYEKVVQAFDSANVYQSSWSYLYSQIQATKSQIPNIIRSMANQMNPNPLGTPFQPEIAVELLKRAEYQVFFNVMNASQYNNESDIRQMFEFIFQTHANKIYQCLGVDIIKMQRVPD
jgi:hypothetical protein